MLIAVEPGLTVRRIVSSTLSEIVAEVDVARDARPGRRSVAFRTSRLDDAVAVYDRVDYVKVTPESSMAAFGNQTYARGFQQFEVLGYQRGPDGKLHTDDDVNLGPLEAAWSMEVFYEVDASRQDRIGTVGPTGLFAPAEANPGINQDVWITATATGETKPDGGPLVGKGYLVVTVPTYTFNGRTFVRDLNRWVEEASAVR